MNKYYVMQMEADTTPKCREHGWAMEVDDTGTTYYCPTCIDQRCEDIEF